MEHEDNWATTVERMYRTEFAGLCGLARRLVDTTANAEDVVQEAFARFAALRTRPTVGCELAYLRSIVRNEARSVLRRRQIRERHARRRETALQILPDDACILADESLRLADQLRQLPARQREVIALRFGGGLSEREIAARLAISPGSVKTHASRGIRSMRDLLTQGAA